MKNYREVQFHYDISNDTIPLTKIINDSLPIRFKKTSNNYVICKNNMSVSTRKTKGNKNKNTIFQSTDISCEYFTLL